MVSQLLSTTSTEVIYPDCDGQPIANNTEQFHWILVIEQNLEWLFADKAIAQRTQNSKLANGPLTV